MIDGRRAILACGAAIWGASISIFAASYGARSDFSIVWAGAGGVLNGQNPYELVGPGRPYEFPYPLAYPFTAILVGLPFALVPIAVANATFCAAGAGLLAWGLTRERLHDPRLLVLVSLPFFEAGTLAQWSPLLVGGALTPGFGWLLACKPTIGLPLLLWRPTLLRAVLAGAMVIVSLIIWPRWPFGWLPTLSAVPHITPPVLLPWGWLLLGLLAVWKYPPAWFLIAVACLPQSPLFYEAITLFLVARTWGESAVLWLTTVTVWAFVPTAAVDPRNAYEALPAGAFKMLWGAYLPAALIVIRQGWRERGHPWSSASMG